MSDLVVVEETGATVVVQEVAPADIVEVVAQGPQGAQGAQGPQGAKGDTGDITPELLAAKVAAEAAATSATASATSATGSASAAASSATAASNSANSASGSATQAANSATSASGSATTATTKASEASASASSASTSASTATTKASEASASASDAATSATSASNSASSASTSATSASASATTATTKASEAATSATNAAASASTATTKASEASTSASNAATSATSAGTSATNAATSATAAAGSATSASSSATSASTSASTATTQAGIATTQAGNAATSATNAATSASTATTKAGEAATSATAAATAQAAAESARDSALAAFDSFDDRYLGVKSSDPTVDNDGNALVAGALYYNSNALGSGGGMKVYDGGTSTWLAAYASLSGALLVANNLSDLGSASTARTNLGLGNVENKSSATIRGEISSSNVTTALGFTPANAASLATVATTGSYSDLLGKPTLFSGAYADLTGKPTLFSGAYADLTGKPTLFSGAYADLTGKPTNVSTFTNDAGYLTGITSTQINTALGYTAQAELVSGTNIKTVNSQSLLGSGNIQIDGGVTSFNTRTGAVTLSSSDVTTALTYTPLNVVGTPSAGQAVVWDSGSSTWVPGTAASKVTRSATEPISPTVGDRWVHDTTGVEYLYLYDGDTYQWIEFGPAAVYGSLAALPVYLNAGTTTNISVANGYLPVTTNGGSTVNVTVS